MPVRSSNSLWYLVRRSPRGLFTRNTSIFSPLKRFQSNAPCACAASWPAPGMTPSAAAPTPACNRRRRSMFGAFATIVDLPWFPPWRTPALVAARRPLPGTGLRECRRSTGHREAGDHTRRARADGQSCASQGIEQALAARHREARRSGGRTASQPGSPVRAATIVLNAGRNGCCERDLDELRDPFLVVRRDATGDSSARTIAGIHVRDAADRSGAARAQQARQMRLVARRGSRGSARARAAPTCAPSRRRCP